MKKEGGNGYVGAEQGKGWLASDRLLSSHKPREKRTADGVSREEKRKKCDEGWWVGEGDIAWLALGY